MPGFRITPRARDDLKNIGSYTEWQWGKKQRNTYLKRFENRFHWLAENPLLGKHRPDVCEGYYSYPVIFNPVVQIAAFKQPVYYARFRALFLG